jgi:branched-chain amino acid transport system permease protein
MVTRLIRRGLTFLRTEVFVLPSRIIVLAFAAGLLVLPLFTDDPYILRILIMTSLFATFAASWDFLAGYSGQVNFGHALFFGGAAYASALINVHAGLPPLLSIPIGALLTGVLGALVGLLCLRLRGPYLSLTTLALPIILVSLFFAMPDLTGGELGIRRVERVTNDRVGNYYIAVIVMLVICSILWKIGDSKFGLILHAIREDQVALRAAGINTTRYKIMAFAISAVAAGLAGAFYGHFMRSVGPSTLDVQLSFQAVIFGVVGGMVSIVGPIAAVFVLYPLTEYLAVFETFREFRLLIFAVIVLLVLLFMPRGFVPWLRDRMETVCPRCKNRNTATRSACRICGTVLR